MTTITQKRKLSKSAWALVLIALIAVIALVVVSVLGIIDLSFLGIGFLAIYSWASIDIINALLLTAGWFTLGVLIYYVVIKYFVGQKVTNTGLGQPGYAPTPAYPSQSQKDTETVIS